MREAPEPAPEFSRPLAVDKLGEAEVVRQIAATEEERAALAHRLGLLSLDHLSAELSVKRLPGKGVIHAGGRFVAAVTQACVVSLEPIPARLSEEFSQLYVLAPVTPEQRVQVIDAEAEEPPEAIGAGGLDLGEAVVQQVALALDPYPRAPGAQLPAGSAEAIERARMLAGPFAVLKALKSDK